MGNATSSSSHEPETGSKQYNVYGQEIDPNNNMPKQPPLPAPQQKTPLSVSRVDSSIPKGGAPEGTTWAYPSPQMFYNALQRKGKGQDVREEDMDVVIAIHNNMNEKTWRLVKQWEDQRVHECSSPKLVKFGGRPDQLSPKAWLRWACGWGKPFDRHDWIVDRCGTRVRYVIDFYHVEEGVKFDQVPGLYDHGSIRSIFVDARPALDSWDALKLRAWNLFKSTGQQLPEEQPLEELEHGKKIMEESLQIKEDALKTFLGGKCGKPMQEFVSCADKHGDALGAAECAKPYLRASFCLGSVLCPDLSQKFISAIANDPESADSVLLEMSNCIQKSKVAQGLMAETVMKAAEAAGKTELLESVSAQTSIA